ncbi:hypothetical protein STENM327S_04956 [Streptomyces tendae]
MQLAAIIVSLVLIVVGVALFGRAVLQIFTYMRLGQPVPAGTRTNDPVDRTVTVVREFLGHTRMNRWGIVGVAHWFVAVGFFSLLLTIVNAVGQLFRADWILPVIGDWAPYNVFVEFIGTMTVLGILVLIVIRQLSHPAQAGPQVPLRGLQLRPGVLRRGRHPHRRRLHLHAARAGGRPPPRGRLQGVVLHLVPGRLRAPGRGPRNAPEPRLLLRRTEDRDLVHLDDHGGPEDRHGTWPGIHLPASWLSPTSAFKRDAKGGTALGALLPDDLGPASRRSRLHRPRRRRRVRRLAGRAVLLEGPAGLLHLHRVRPSLPVAVPRVEHRQAALPQAP